MTFRIDQMDDVIAAVPRAEYLPVGDHPARVRAATFQLRQTCAFLDVLIDILPPSPAAGQVRQMLLYVEDEGTAARAMHDLAAMGLADAADWSARQGRPFSREFPACAPRLVGLEFLGNKRLVVRPDGRVYHRFFVVRPLPEAPPKAAPFDLDALGDVR